MSTIMLKVIRSSVRNHLFLIFGLIIGICLSAFTTQNKCSTPEQKTPIVDDFEPRINLVGKPIKAQKTPQDFIRPRYYSTELGIREKLFLAVITSPSTVNTRGIAVNTTTAHTVDKIMFFMEAEEKKTKSDLNGIVQFTDMRAILKPFHLIKYIDDNFVDEYDYFFIVNDSTYVNGRKLLNIAQLISVSENVHAGSGKMEFPNFCSLDSGILLSSSVLKRTAQNLDWCVKNAYSSFDDANLGRCILHATNIACQSTVQGVEIHSFKIDISLQQNFTSLIKNEEFSQAVTLWPIAAVEDYYKLHMYFAKTELKKIKYEVSSLRRSITNNKNSSSSDVTWPVGNQPFSKPLNRFDVIRWDYFTDTHIYLKTDFSNVEQLSGADLADIKYIIKAASDHIQSKYFGQYDYKKLVNGYRKFDPARGMDYVLDLMLTDVTNGKNLQKRIKICKPLGKTEVIPMPYITENTRVNFVLFVNKENKNEVIKFLESYLVVCMEKHDKTSLMLVLQYEANQPSKGSNQDLYSDIKKLAVTYTERFKKDNSKVAWLSVRLPDGVFVNDGILTILIMDLVVKKFTNDNLILLATSNMEIRQDYLNRVRMNTIKEKQIFSPIPFSEYNPLIIYNDDLTRPKDLDINKNYGHYDDKDTQHISFYIRDYRNARKNMEHILPYIHTDKDLSNVADEISKQIHHQWSTDPFMDVTKRISLNSLYTMFVSHNKVNILRAIEPGLRLKYKRRDCYKYNIQYNKLNSELYDACVEHRSLNEGSRSHLAKLILDYLNQVKSI